MTQTHGPAGRKGFMPHVRGIGEDDRPDDVGRVFELLVRVGEIDDPEVFICPSSDDQEPASRDLSDLDSWRIGSTDVRDPNASFSYAWTKEQRTDGNSKGSTIVSGDRAIHDFESDDDELWNHPDGRNIVRFDGSVDFLPRAIEEGAPGAPSDPELLEALERINFARR